MGGMDFYIKDWESNFNPLKTSIDEIPIWVRLYNLPRKYWDIETLKIGNILGTFIEVDEAIEKKDFSMYARICINWKLFPSLPKAIEI